MVRSSGSSGGSEQVVVAAAAAAAVVTALFFDVILHHHAGTDRMRESLCAHIGNTPESLLLTSPHFNNVAPFF